MANAWALISGEIAPGSGGVADYTVQLAAALAAAGDVVHVWAPEVVGPATGEVLARAGVEWHPLTGGFGRAGRRQLNRELQRLQPSPRILLQYVPHAFGYRAMNVPLCRWFARQRGRRPWVMFHEVVLAREPGQPLRHRLLAAVTWSMAARLQKAAARSFVSIPAWDRLLHEIAPGSVPSSWLPVPSNLATEVPPAVAAAARARLLAPARVTDCCSAHEPILDIDQHASLAAERGQGTAPAHATVLGWFGGRLDAYTSGVLMQTIPTLLRADQRRVALLAGAGGAGLRSLLLATAPDLRERLHAPGALSAVDTATYLAAADLLLQPYPDGVSSRRGSAMAGLALGCALLTTSGPLTEPVWAESAAVRLVPVSDTAAFTAAAENLLQQPAHLALLGAAAGKLYRQRFALSHTVRMLRQQAENT